MATMTFVLAEDTEAGDVVNLANAEIIDSEGLVFLPDEDVKLLSDPEDVDTFSVRLTFAEGSVVVTRKSELHLTI